MDTSVVAEDGVRQCKAVYERGGVFVHIATTNGEETHVPGRLLLQEVGGEAHVDWSPVKTTNCADDEQGWALVQKSSNNEMDEDYQHLMINFKLEDVVSVTRTEQPMELPRMMFEFGSADRKAEALYFHSAQPAEFWQCLNRYLVLARCPANATIYRVQGRTDALARSLHGLNFSAEDSEGIVSSFFSTGVEVLGGFSRVTQFVRSQLGGGAGSPVDDAAMEEVYAPDVTIPLGDEQQAICPPDSPRPRREQPASPSASLLPGASIAAAASPQPEEQSVVVASVGSAAAFPVDSLVAAAHCPLGSLTGSEVDVTPVPSVTQEQKEQAVIVTEPTGSLAAQSVHGYGSSVDVPVESSGEDAMFESARTDVVVEEPYDLRPSSVEPLSDSEAGLPVQMQRNAPGKTLVDLDGYFAREEPVSLSEWKQHLSSTGHVENVSRLRRRIFKGGLTQEARPIVWKFLLHHHNFNASCQEREQAVAVKREQYFALQQQWQTMFPQQLKRFTLMERRLEIIDKDVIRTDRTHPKFADESSPYMRSLTSILRSYSIYNFNLGYVQGMSDLLAPILAVMDDEVDAFWCFAGLMDMIEDNFSEDMRGMRLQLEQLLVLLRVLDPNLVDHLQKSGSDNMFFCFRWLLVFFKREFEFEEVMRLWEVLWSCYLTPHFELFFAAAILTQQRQLILSLKMDSNDLITHVNGLAEQMDLDMMLIEAERLCRDLLSKPVSSLPAELQSLFPVNGALGEQDSSV